MFKLRNMIIFGAFLFVTCLESTKGQWNTQWPPEKDEMKYRRSTDIKDNTNIQSSRYAVNEPIYSNDTDINIVIDQIINSRREGRNLGDFDQVYADGNIDQALQQGNDMQARNLIRDKLCTLGLMSCDAEEKRPHYSTIYAQGPPPTQGFAGGPYTITAPGSFITRPPPNSLNHYGPPRKVGYEVPFKPNYRPSSPSSVYNGPYLESLPTIVEGATFNNPHPGGIIYGSKPPGPVFMGSNNLPPYTFEKPSEVTEKIQAVDSVQNNFYSQKISSSSAVPSSAPNIVVGTQPNPGNLQQHVHHHYHHVEETESPAKIPKVPIPISSGQTINTDFSALAQSSTAFTQSQSAAFNAGFNGASQGGLLTQSAGNGFGPVYKPNGGVYKPVDGLNSYGESTANQGGLLGVPGSSYHSLNPNYFKKELHNTGGLSGSTNLNSLSPGYGGDTSFYKGGSDTARQQFVDCQCVPFNMCPAADRIGRKEDLILPIDPRNIGKDIEALSDEAIANTTVSSTVKSEEPKKNEENKSTKRSKRDVKADDIESNDNYGDHTDSAEGRAYYANRPAPKTCRIHEVCCRQPLPSAPQQQFDRCGVRNAAGITGRIKTPVYVDGDSEFGEYPWHVAILKKDPKESIYACGATLIDAQHVITAAHCIKSQNGFDLRARLGEWDVNHDVEFFPYIERDVVSVHIHPEYYAGTLDNDLAVLKLDHPVDFTKNPHISPACLPDKFSDFTGARCWTTGWGKDAFGDLGKYQNILKEVDVPILSHHQCEQQLRQTRLGYNYKLNPGFVCAGGEEGKDACKGDGGGPLVCERNGVWNVVGIVSWGIGCGQVNVPGVYIKVSHYLDWIRQITEYYK